MDQIYLCSVRHLFARTAVDKPEATLSEGCVSFTTSQGFFAALGHNEDIGAISYEGSELYATHLNSDAPFQAGKVLCSRPSGIYGAFYDDYTAPVHSKVDAAALHDLKIGEPAELYLPDENGKLRVIQGRIVALFPDKPHPVLFEVDDLRFSGVTEGCSGSVIIQGGRLAAVVAGANEDPAVLLYCTSAEQMVNDLKTMIYEIATGNEGEE